MASLTVQQSGVSADTHQHDNPDIKLNDVVNINVANLQQQQQGQQQRAKAGKADSSRSLKLTVSLQ
jgi:hypothetical protein